MGGKCKQIDTIARPIGMAIVMPPVGVLAVVAGQRRQEIGMHDFMSMRAV